MALSFLLTPLWVVLKQAKEGVAETGLEVKSFGIIRAC
jgi:hypothetical protein